MAKGGESLGNKESSEEEEEVIPALNHTPGVRPLAPGVVFSTKTSFPQNVFRDVRFTDGLMACLRASFTQAPHEQSRGVNA